MPNAYIGAFSLHVQYGSNFAESLGFPTLPTLNCEVATSKEGHKTSINQLSNCLCPLYDRIRGAATSPTRRWLESGCKRWICGDRSTVQRHGGYTFTSSLRISPSQLSTGRICLFLYWPRNVVANCTRIFHHTPFLVTWTGKPTRALFPRRDALDCVLRPGFRWV